MIKMSTYRGVLAVFLFNVIIVSHCRTENVEHQWKEDLLEEINDGSASNQKLLLIIVDG